MFADWLPKKKLFNDLSLWLLLLSNFITIIFATVESWNFSTIIWVYWFQSIVIGLFNFVRILQLKEFSTEGFKINNRPAQPTQKTKRFTAFFFLFHYGGFHAAYLIFLSAGMFAKTPGNVPAAIDWANIFLAASIFFISHLFSYIYNRPKDSKKQNIGSLMFYPYVRIIPMHLTIILSGASGAVLGSAFGGTMILFLALKTLADCLMHVIEHNVLRKGEEQLI